MNSFDYIVVGGGTAGCVIASRLTENDSTRVLLLEAGPAEPLDAMAVPPAWPTLLAGPANWGDVTVKQAATGTSTPLARGRALGGSSAINAMGFVRGHRSSYDAWVSAGAEGWGFDDLLPYFQRSENAVGRDPGVRGVGGPLTVGPANPPNPVIAACMDAASEQGHGLAADISSGLEVGFGLLDLNIVGGRRQSAADAYLRPVLARPNLEIVPDALVHRLHIAGDRCTDVVYSTGQDLISASCSGEVILTAGSIGSAQLLMLSGIGPSDHLEQVGVDVVLDLPGVGSNFHDHPITNVVYRSARPVPAARNNHGEGFGLLRSDPAVETPDFQILFLDAPGHLAAAGEHGYCISAALTTPRSRGTVRLASNEPGSAPVLNPNHYDDDHDYALMVTALRAAREIGQAEALGHLLPQRGEVTRLEHEHFVARLERIDDGGLPRAGAGRREDDHRPLGAEDRPETFGDLRHEARELRTAVIDRRPIHRPQDSIGDIGRSGDLEEVTAALEVHGRLCFRVY